MFDQPCFFSFVNNKLFRSPMTDRERYRVTNYLSTSVFFVKKKKKDKISKRTFRRVLFYLLSNQKFRNFLPKWILSWK